MDLHDGRITLRQLLGHPEAKKILQRELPQYMKPGLIRMAGGMSLNQILSYAKGTVPKSKVDSILHQLKDL